jgi:hypothetical protein
VMHPHIHGAEIRTNIAQVRLDPRFEASGGPHTDQVDFETFSELF